jgi:hypothetical protein
MVVAHALDSCSTTLHPAEAGVFRDDFTLGKGALKDHDAADRLARVHQVERIVDAARAASSA